MRRCVVVILMSGMLAGLPARSLTVEEAVRLALENNPGLRGSQAALQASAAKVREVVASALPSVKLNAGYTRLSEVDPFVISLPVRQPPLVETLSASVVNNYTSRLSMQQPIFTGLKLVSAVTGADNILKAARQDYARDRAALVYNVRSAYWSLLKARESEAVIERSVAQVEAHLKDVRNLAEQGMVLRNDVLKVQVQLDNVRLLQIDIRNAVQTATVALNSLTGLALDTSLEPCSEPDSTGATAGELPDLVTEALQSRPEVKALEARVRASADGVRVAQAGWYPQVALTGNYYFSRPNPRIFPTKDEFRATWDVGVGASFDVWNWGAAAHQTAQARAQQVQLQSALAQLRDATALEVTQDYLAYRKSVEKARAAAGAVEQAAENLRMVKAGFTEGTLLSSDLLDAEVSLLQAELSRTQARADIELARAKLVKTLGSE